jgi:hypothetical protein
MKTPNAADRSLLSVDLPYYNLSPSDWELSLVRLRQLGIQTLTLQVPWAWHEPTPGQFDFTGTSHPQRNVVACIEVAAQLGFQVILRPGPHANALPRGGVPFWWLQQDATHVAQHADGETFRRVDGLPLPDRHVPAYTQAVQHWFTAFSSALCGFQAPGGPIVQLILDGPPLLATSSQRLVPQLTNNPRVTTELWHMWGEQVGWHQPFAVPATPSRTLAEFAQLSRLRQFVGWLEAQLLNQAFDLLQAAGWKTPIGIGLLYQHDNPIWLDLTTLNPAIQRCTLRIVDLHLAECHVLCGPQQASTLQRTFNGLPQLANLLWRLSVTPDGGHVAAESQMFAALLRAGATAFHVTVDPFRLVHPDGVVQTAFWNLRLPLLFLQAASTDLVEAQHHADLLVGWSSLTDQFDVDEQFRPVTTDAVEQALVTTSTFKRLTVVVQKLIRAGVTFHMCDLDQLSAEQMAQYRMLLTPSSVILPKHIQQTFAQQSHLALLGEHFPELNEYLEPCQLLGRHPEPVRLPDNVPAEYIGDLLESYGGHTRYAWADSPDVDVNVRHGRDYLYLIVLNRQAKPYIGMVAYRDANQEILHIHLSLGAWRLALIMLRDDEVCGIAIDGDTSQGNWLVRGARSSATFSGGAALMIPCGGALRFMAMQSGQFQVRRPQGWENVVLYRLLLSGELLPTSHQSEVTHLSVAYLGEDERGQTDSYVLMPASASLPVVLVDELTTLLQARTICIERLALQLQKLLAATPLQSPRLQREVQELIYLMRQCVGRLQHTKQFLQAQKRTPTDYIGDMNQVMQSLRLTRAFANNLRLHLIHAELDVGADLVLLRMLDEQIVALIQVLP